MLKMCTSLILPGIRTSSTRRPPTNRPLRAPGSSPSSNRSTTRLSLVPGASQRNPGQNRRTMATSRRPHRRRQGAGRSPRKRGEGSGSGLRANGDDTEAEVNANNFLVSNSTTTTSTPPRFARTCWFSTRPMSDAPPAPLEDPSASVRSVDVEMASISKVNDSNPDVQPLSQESSYSELPDISDIILLAPTGTQLTKSIKSSKSCNSSASSFSRSDSNTSSVSPSSSAAQLQPSTSNSSTSLFSRTDSNTSTSSTDLAPSVHQTKSSDDMQTPGPTTVLGKRKTRDFTTESPSSVPVPPNPYKLASAPGDEAPVIISHSRTHQRLFNSLGLPYGVRYEIARIAATISTGYDTLDKTGLEKLKGLSNAKAIPMIPGLFGKGKDSIVDGAFAKEVAAKAPWTELDLEDENLSKNPLAGLGLSTESPDWFGGKVHFTGKFMADPKNRGDPFKVVLKTPELGPSDRFARRWGSERFLTLSLSKDVLKKNTGEKLIDCLCRPFILGDRVFRAFDAKDGNVFFVCTNEIVEGKRINPTRTVPGIPSLRDFLAWHNPLELDMTQTMTKWASRFALGRSNSAPVLRLDEDAILQIPDITSEAGSDMTDGAGLINKAGLRLIYNRVEMDTWPTAIQCRVVGAKGLLVMHPTDVDETPRIWLRPSQIKVKHRSWEDPTLRTIDLLRSSSVKTQCRLSVEMIINLAENGVPSKAFTKLVEDAMVNLVTPLITWEGQDAMEMLWCAVARTGGVMSSRLARKELVLARVKGYSDRDTTGDLEHDGEEEETNGQATSTAWWVDEVSGCPSSLEETAMYLLDAGFTPENCSVLRSKLAIIVKGCVDRYIESYRIDLPVGMSAMAFLIPDELGVLEPGEFFLKSSRHDFQTRDGLPTDMILGDALLARHPCKLPTDVQKWKGVDRPELRHFTNVIVLSVKGPRRAADYLGGGDYDGDKAVVIWQPELVDPFVNAPLHFADEPADLAASFKPQNETVGEFLGRTAESPSQQLREMKNYLLSAVRDRAVVGKYNNWHLNATHSLGYQHPETIRLGYMFGKTLDGAKTGLSVLPTVYTRDCRTYDKRPPVWKEAGKKKTGQSAIDQTNTLNLTRDPGLDVFIMDKLHSHIDRGKWGSVWGKDLKDKIDARFSVPHLVDTDLTAPWLAFVEKEAAKKDADKIRRGQIALMAQHALQAPGLSTADRTVAEWLLDEGQANPETDIERIQKHVAAVWDKHKCKIDSKFSKLPIERRQDILRELSRDFATGPTGLLIDADEAARIKASYAYVHDTEAKRGDWSRFPWNVAFRELCLIKCRASDSFKPVKSEFYERMKVR
ncbi:RNA dependent RNA polymerase-domain-containing protein [Mycena vulgaris]|nr:RNA dependent RNA polymerase-domain-containing protein [Mycena vulgaris]